MCVFSSLALIHFHVHLVAQPQVLSSDSACIISHTTSHHISQLWIHYNEYVYLLSPFRICVEMDAPNLSNLLTPLTAEQLIFAAGGLNRLARLTSDSICQVGSNEIERGYIYNSSIVQNCIPQLRQRVAKVVADKTALAARCDAYRGPMIDYENQVQDIIEKLMTKMRL